MPVDVAEAFVTLRPNLAGFRREMETGLRSSRAGIKGLENDLDGTARKANVLGNALKGVGVIAGGLVLARGIMQIPQLFTGATKAASDLGESQNAVRQIFKDSSDTILGWGKNNANAFGLSQRAFNQLATPLGASLRNMGFNQDQVAISTIALTERASDMASVFNTDVSQALEAISSALRGEADPIERFGVSVNEAAVNLRALGMTGKKSAEDLTVTGKAAARLSLIFEQTASTQGDFTRTSGENANAARIAAAKIEELQAAIGQRLLPVSLKITEAKLQLANTIATHLVPALDRLKGWVDQNRAAIREAATAIKDAALPMIKAFADGLRGLLPLVQGLFGYVISNRAAMVAAITAIGAAIALSLGPTGAAWAAVAGMIALYGKLKQVTADATADADIRAATGFQLNDDALAALRAAARGLGIDPKELARTVTVTGNEIGARGSNLSPGTMGVMIRGVFVPLSDLLSVADFDIPKPDMPGIRMPDVSAQVAQLTAGLTGGSGLAFASGAAADAVSGAADAIDDMAQRVKAASERIVEGQTSDVVKGFLEAVVKGADPDLAVSKIRAVQALEDQEWSKLIGMLHEKLGVQVPDEFRGMWEQIIEETQNGRRDAFTEWRDTLRQRLASIGRLLPAGLSPKVGDTHNTYQITVNVPVDAAGRVNTRELTDAIVNATVEARTRASLADAR